MNTAAVGAAAAAAHIQAIKASGVVVQLEPDAFRDIVQRQQEPLVVCAESGFFTTSYQYLSSYRGQTFFTRSQTPINLPKDAEIVAAKSIYISTSH